jgi:hypothetical protein
MVGIDNRCSGCITHDRSDIPGEIVQVRRSIKGFGGARTFNVWMGTIHWNWDDDSGQTHTMVIPNSFYVPDGKMRLLSPQHWAQHRTGVDKRYGSGEYTNALQTVLYWNNKKHFRTVPLDPGNNVATFRLSPGYKHYHKYCSDAGMEDDEAHDRNPLTEADIHAQESVVTDDEDEEEVPSEDETNDDEFPQADEPRLFNLDGPETDEERDAAPKVVPDEEDRISETPSSELLRAHYDFGHIPFVKLQAMAKQGILPPRLSKCNIPVCSACQYAKATKKQWRSKMAKNWSHAYGPLAPGQVVSVDQLVSPSPGLIAQMVGFITKDRYRYATVYVDQASGLGYVHLQKTSTASETLEGKRAFEKYALN